MWPPGMLLLLFMLETVQGQITVPTSGQCQAVCLKEVSFLTIFSKRVWREITIETLLIYFF